MPTILGKAPMAGRKPKVKEGTVERVSLEEAVGMPRQVNAPSAWPFPETGPEPADPLDALVHAGSTRALQIILWKQRFVNPDMSVQINPADIEKLKACTNYLGVKPTLKIWRRPAIESAPATPAQGNRRAMPGNPGSPAANFVIVQLVDENGNNIRPVENDEEDNDIRIKHDALRQLKADVPGMVSAIRGAIGRGAMADGEVLALCDAALVLVKS